MTRWPWWWPSPSTHVPVAFTGQPGAYSEEAALRRFGSAAPTLTCGSSAEALAAVAEGRASHAVIAVENSITGPFDGPVESLFNEDRVSVVGEVALPIRHCLLGAHGSRLDEVAVVASHQSALSQCRDFLASWGVATRPAQDTAQAARELGTNRDAALGVIGSRTLAEIYDLDVLAEGIADRPDNVNRFLVVARNPESESSGRRTTVLVGPVLAPRALKTLRIQLEAYGASRVRVPFLGSSDGRSHLIEFDHRTGL
ncbi:MAG: prephenate dehydratase, partial [Planctomycetota bacterium]